MNAPRALAAVGLLAITSGVAPVQAGSGGATLGGVSVQYSYGVARFDGPGCANAPLSMTYSKPDDWDFDLDLELRQQGSNTKVSDGVSIYDNDDPNSGTVNTSTCLLEDYEFTPGGGPFAVTGTLSVEDSDFNSLGSVPVTDTSVAVVRNKTWFNRLKVRSGTTVSKLPVVKGRVVARTYTKGTVGAEGSITVEGKVNGRWRKTDFSITPDRFGRFSAELWNKVPTGMKIRVRLTDCGWCTDARAKTTAK